MSLAIVVFIIVVLSFSLSGLLFPIDRQWYRTLKKPSWTPSGKVIGMIWAVLYVLIALSLAIVEYKVGLKNTSIVYIALLIFFATLPYSTLAALLLIPYVLWSVIATYLAWTISRYNPSYNVRV
ncbi:TspO/MBR family protein [Paenibacillus cymbidii]|uniref:TspO/MBR family protein n=1 Tax=Paenibacillus cymbidii TaxID=1639034 RepID=UPI001082275D